MASVTKGRQSSFTQAEIDFEGSNWNKARIRFVKAHTNNTELRLFLESRMQGSDVKNMCLKMQQESDNKYHSGFGSILENINALMNIGDVAIKSAPESVGLAWMGIRMCLNAVQGDWSTFQLFSGACADIIGIMISCRVYGKLYSERDGEGIPEDFRELHERVVDYIPDIYSDILEFSYAVNKYASKNLVIRIGKNIFKDTRNKFEAIIGNIKASDEKMRDFAKTASERMMAHMQEKTIKGQDEMKSEIASLKGILETSLKANEAIVRRAFEEFEEEKKSMRKKTPYEKAQDEFEDNMAYLDPTAEQYELLQENLDVKREPGTCQWLLKDEEYARWRKSSHSSMIWISGAGGYGKSILMSTVIETLRAETTNSDKEIVQYFFCKAGSDATQATLQILKTIVAQLYNRSLAFPDLLEQTNEIVSNGLSKRNSKGGLGFDFVTLYGGLLRLMNRTVFLVIDAIDECVDRIDKQLLKNLRRIVKLSEAKVRIMVCSRPETDIGNELSGIANIKCEGRNTDDIRKNVTTEMNKFPSWTASEKADAVEKIATKSGGQFRYVQIALDFLRKPLVRPYKRVLEKLPDSLTGSYQTSWNATDKDYLDLLKTALTWTLFADGPVTVPEIMDAYTRAYSDDAGVVTKLEDYQPVEGEINLHDRQIRIAGGNFLEVSSSRTVSLRHLTVRDFFVRRDETSNSSADQNVAQRSPWTISAKEGHLEMTRILVQNLASPAFQEKYLSPHTRERRASNEKQAQVGEAGNGEEVNGEETEEEVDEAEEHDDEDDDDDEGKALELANQDYAFSDFEDDDDLWSGPHHFHPFKQTEEEDRDEESHRIRRDVVHRRRYEVTHWTYHLHEAQKLWSWEEQKSNASWKAIWQFLTKFMCEDIQAFESWQAISFKNADLAAHSELSESPLKGNGYHYGNPLQIAAVFNLTSLARILIEKGHKVTERKLFTLMSPLNNFPPDSLIATYHTTTPLNVAVEKQHVDTDMVKLCIENGCDVNDPTTGFPPFTMAVWHEPSYDFVKYLIDHGARGDVEDDEDCFNALHRFTLTGSDPRVLQLLLDAGIDINEKSFASENGKSPLLTLVDREDPPLELIRAYLEAGANVNEEDLQSERPLIGLVRRAKSEAVKLLIDHGADVHDPDKKKRTAMHWVAKSGDTQTLDLLVAEGVDINQPDKLGRTPLFYACQYNNEDLAKRLLKDLVDQPVVEVNKQDHRYRTPLRQAAAHGMTDIVKTILTLPGATGSINLRDGHLDQTPLHKAAHNGERATLEVLVAHGGDLSITDRHGLTPFDLCMRAWTNNRSKSTLKSLEDTLVFLISQSKETQSREKRDLLFRAVMKGSLRIVQNLLESGLDPDFKDAFGWSPPMVAERWQQNTIIDMLKSSSTTARPTSWILLLGDKASLSNDGLQASFSPYIRYNSLTIVSDQPIPATSAKYYFEIKVRALYKPFCVVVGLTSLPTKLENSELGRGLHGIKSCGWRSKDGRLSGQDSVSDVYPTFASGDIIGCAVNLKEQTVFYTKNGERLEIAFTSVVGRLHPAITAVFGDSENRQPPVTNTLIRANFGGDLKNRPWKWEGWEAWSNTK